MAQHLKRRSLLHRFRHWIGLTDEWHGHLRPGYDADGLRILLGPRFIKEFRLLTALYPALWLTAKLDALLPFQAGYKLIIRATLRPAPVS